MKSSFFSKLLVISKNALTREDARQKCDEGSSQFVSFNNYADFYEFAKILHEMKIKDDIWLGKFLIF